MISACAICPRTVNFSSCLNNNACEGTHRRGVHLEHVFHDPEVAFEHLSELISADAAIPVHVQPPEHLLGAAPDELHLVVFHLGRLPVQLPEGLDDVDHLVEGDEAIALLIEDVERPVELVVGAAAHGDRDCLHEVAERYVPATFSDAISRSWTSGMVRLAGYICAR